MSRLTNPATTNGYLPPSGNTTQTPQDTANTSYSHSSQYARKRRGSEDGSWLSAEGVYQAFVTKCTALNPGLKKPDPRNADVKTRTGRVVALEFDREDGVELIDFTAPENLDLYVRSRESAKGKRTLYILENIQSQYVSVFGAHFAIDPGLFLAMERYPRMEPRDRDHNRVSDSVRLPSSVQPEKSFGMSYPDVRYFGSDFNHHRIICVATGRPVLSIGFEHKLDQVGTVCRKAVFWAKDEDGGGWSGEWVLASCEENC
jgi:hypothetical protein